MRRSMLTGRAVLPPAFVAAGAVGNAATIAKPAGVQSGDTVYVLVARENSDPAGPSGFTTVGSVSRNEVGVADLRFFVYRRTIDGSEGSTFVATGDGGCAVAYRNVSTTAASSATSNAAGTTLTYPDVTSAAGEAVIGFGLAYGASAIATPSGHVERLDGITGGAYRFQVADIIPAVGDVGSATATATSAQITLAVRAAFAPA